MVLLYSRRRKLVTSVALGCWLFAFFVGIVHACELMRPATGAHRVAMATIDGDGGASHGQNDSDKECPDCAQFSASNLTGPSASNYLQTASNEQRLIVALSSQGAIIASSAVPLASRLDRRRPPPGIALYARFVRLAL